MDYFITKEDIPNYLKLPSTFDFDLVDQDLGFGKIFDIFSKEIYLNLKYDFDASKKEIFRLLTKAAIHYSFVMSLPRIKVQITSYGIQEFVQEKMKSSSWWDVRDLGLSLLKIADKNLSDSISKAYQIDDVRNQIPFFPKVTGIINTPSDFESIYSINNSPDVFLMIQPLLQQSLDTKIKKQINEDCLLLVKGNDQLNIYLKKSLVYYSLYYASSFPGFIFLQGAIAIQYDELPWQKSIVLDERTKTNAGNNFLKLADENLKNITDFMKQNSTQFPCYNILSDEMQMRNTGFGISLF